MAAGSRQKHARGHQDFARACRSHGWAARCTYGVLDRRSFPGLTPEICRANRLRLEEAMGRAEAHAEDDLPVLVHRADRKPWRVTMDLAVFLRLYAAFIQRPLPDPAVPASAPYHGSDPDPARRPAERPAP